MEITYPRLIDWCGTLKSHATYWIGDDVFDAIHKCVTIHLLFHGAFLAPSEGPFFIAYRSTKIKPRRWKR